jgi:hypothetical protein
MAIEYGLVGKHSLANFKLFNLEKAVVHESHEKHEQIHKDSMLLIKTPWVSH